MEFEKLSPAKASGKKKQKKTQYGNASQNESTVPYSSFLLRCKFLNNLTLPFQLSPIQRNEVHSQGMGKLI